MHVAKKTANVIRNVSTHLTECPLIVLKVARYGLPGRIWTGGKVPNGATQDLSTKRGL